MLTAVCAYFNPLGSRARERAYARFRAGLEAAGVALVCAEQTFAGVPRVGGDGDLSVVAGDLLWQKECLLQLGVGKALAAGASRLLLLDADILFETPDAWARIDRSFDDLDWFQPFESVALDYSDGPLVRASALSFPDPRYGVGHPGSCWAGTAEVFRTVPIYPYALLGGGDVVMTHLLAWCWKHGPHSERFADLAAYLCGRALYSGLLPSVLAWAEAAGRCRFRYGHTPEVRIRALDHGSRARRRYHGRYAAWAGAARPPLPGQDFRVGTEGLLTWAETPNPWGPVAAKYFESREREAPDEPARCGA
jgi:hypothetical protein